MTIHFKKQCFIVENIVCDAPCETKWNKSQPNLVMQGFCIQVKVENEIGYIY